MQLNAYAQALVAQRAKTPLQRQIATNELIDVSITARDVGTVRRTLVTRELLARLRPAWPSHAGAQEENLRTMLRVAGQAMRHVTHAKQDGAPFSAFVSNGRDRLGKAQNVEVRCYLTIDGARGNAVISLAKGGKS